MVLQGTQELGASPIANKSLAETLARCLRHVRGGVPDGGNAQHGGGVISPVDTHPLRSAGTSEEQGLRSQPTWIEALFTIGSGAAV